MDGLMVSFDFNMGMGYEDEHVMEDGTVSEYEEHEIEDGTVEFFNNNLIVLSASVINIKDLSKEFIDNLNKDTQKKLAEKDITDQDRYMFNHKLDVLKEIRI